MEHELSSEAEILRDRLKELGFDKTLLEPIRGVTMIRLSTERCSQETLATIQDIFENRYVSVSVTARSPTSCHASVSIEFPSSKRSGELPLEKIIEFAESLATK